MAEFNVQDVAFTGFVLVRRHPRAIAAWAVYALLVSFVFGLVVVGLMGPDVARLMEMGTQASVDPDRIWPILARLAPGYFVMVVFALTFNAILGAAMIRAVLRPLDDRLGFLRLGPDELRQLGLGLVTFVAFLGVYFAAVTVLALAAAVAGAVLGKAGAGTIAIVGGVGVVGGMIYIAVRLSLAPALTFDLERITLLGSWSLTRGIFVRLFATYLLTFVLIVIIYLLSGLVMLAIMTLVVGGGPAPAPESAFTLAGFLSPRMLVQSVLSAIVSALVWPVLFTPPVAAYRTVIKPRIPDDIFL